jgi:ABC-2 type transport system ATP-binding protein
MPATPSSSESSDRSIVAERVGRTFGDLRAVDAVDLDVPSGGVFGFLGPNGAGKSTLVRILTTILAPSEGRATVAGYDIQRDAAAVRRSIGVALQDVGLDKLMTARELLVLQGRVFGMTGHEAARTACRLLETVDLADVDPRKRVGDYSGGMKRRLDLALALVHDPGIVFLDEPTTGLDPISRAAIWEEIRRLNRRDGVTIFLTTQYLEEADRLADEVAIIDRGRIVAHGSPGALKQEIGKESVTLTFADAVRAQEAERVLDGSAARSQLTGRDGRDLVLYLSNAVDVIPEIVRRLDGVDIALQGLSVSRPTLDDVFLRATGVRLSEVDEAASQPDAERASSAGSGEAPPEAGEAPPTGVDEAPPDPGAAAPRAGERS